MNVVVIAVAATALSFGAGETSLAFVCLGFLAGFLLAHIQWATWNAKCSRALFPERKEDHDRRDV